MSYVSAGRAIPLSTLSGVVGSAPPVAQNVTFERILEARTKEPHNWLTYYGAYDGQRFSPLDQINTQNVSRLRPAWVFQFGTIGIMAGASTYAFEATPIVVDGVMYVSGWDGWVWALDAKTGKELWRYKHASPFDITLCCGNVNRGVAVAKGKVFLATLNARLVALDATTGKQLWSRPFGDVRAGESATVAPLVVKNLVIVGSSGGEFGNRGHLDAFDIDTGEHVWRTYTVPKPGEPGSETWPAEGEPWARGGGNCWVTGTYDPELNLLYWGTGNPSPDFDGTVREGDNLYTDCVIAVDADTGKIRWHYQFTPHDVWDYDSTMECILFELDGQKLLGHFDKNGYFFVLDRTNGKLVRVAPFADRINWGQIDASGKVTVLVAPKEGEEVHFWPGPAGAKNGRTQHIARRQGSSTSRSRRWERGLCCDGGCSRRTSPTGARTFSLTPRISTERSRPSIRGLGTKFGDGGTIIRCVPRCWLLAVALSSPERQLGSSTRSMRALATCCGNSSAAVATTAVQSRTWWTESSTSQCQSAGERGVKGLTPRRWVSRLAMRCSHSHYRIELEKGNTHTRKEVMHDG